MTDKQPMQADGGKGDAATPDGVNNAPGDGSTGSHYPNGVKAEEGKGGFFGHGGQTEQEYSGSEGGESNAATE